MKNKANLSTVSSLISCIALGIMFATIDGLTYGCFIFPTENLDEQSKIILKNISIFIYITSTAISQLVYGLTTSLESGILASFIIESHNNFKQIYQNIKQNNEGSSLSYLVSNTLCCTGVSTFIFVLLSYLLMKTGFGRLQLFMPKSVLYGCLASIGLGQLTCVKEELGLESLLYLMDLKYFLITIISVALAIGALFLERRYPNAAFLIPVYMFSIFVIFHTIAKITGQSLEDLYNKKLLNSISNVQFKFSDTFDVFSIRSIKLKNIFQNASNILSLAIYNLIHMPVNTSTFSIETNINYNYESEYKAQCFSNLCSMLIGAPTYFVCSNSIFFRRCGGKSRLSSILMAPVILSMYFFAIRIKVYLPRFLLSFVPLFIGLAYLESYVLKTFFTLRKYDIKDFYILICVAIICNYFEFVWGLFLGLFLNFCVFCRYYYKSVVDKKEHKKFENSITVNYIVNFITIKKLINDIESANVQNDEVLIDMRECVYIDWLARDILQKKFQSSKNKFKIVGNPEGIMKEEISNVKISKEYSLFS